MCLGQDGSYPVDLKLKKNYEVHGIVFRTSSFNSGGIDKYLDVENFTN